MALGSFDRDRCGDQGTQDKAGRYWPVIELKIELIAKRERCSVRKANMAISLAFLAPDLVKAAIDGRLPHGMGVTRLADLPAEWSRQHRILGLPAQ